MSKISLAPDVSGSGTFTIAAPDSSTDRTLTLPDNSGTVQTQLDHGFGFRNRLINSDMRIDQRNNGASVTVNALNQFFAVDRWYGFGQAADGVYTLQQNTTAPAGFTSSIKATVTTADASLSATNVYGIQQRIEGFNVADFGWGTANAQPITVSFWVQSSVTGAFGARVANGAANRSYPFSYTISAANTWEYKTVTIPGDTTGTWLTTNGIGISLVFSLGAGSSLTGAANAWAAADYVAPTGSVNLIATNGATFYITGVQLEAGSVATPFERRPYGTELQLAQRYFEIVARDCGVSGYSTIWSQPLDTFANCWTPIRFAVPKRSTGYSFGLYSGATWQGGTPTIFSGSVEALVLQRGGFYYLNGGAGANSPLAYVSSEL